MNNDPGKYEKNKPKRRFIFWSSVLIITLLIIESLSYIDILIKKDNLKRDALYKFIPGDSRTVQEFFLGIMNPVGLLIGFIIGILLTYLLIYIYLLILKKFRNTKIVGFIRIKSDMMSLKTFVSRVILAGFLTMSLLLVFVENEYFATFWWKHLDEYNYYLQHESNGKYGEIFSIPWQWIALTITMTLLIPCWIILDSGLVSVHEFKQYDNFKDTERVGDFYYNMVKGYVGISLFISWILMMLSGNIGFIVLPLNTFFYCIPFIAALDLMRNFTRKLVASAARKVYKLQLIDLEIGQYDLKSLDDIKLVAH
ncbi:MAG: hypothetical protein ACFFAT_20025 [Promethearchaeota archaeon]